MVLRGIVGNRISILYSKTSAERHMNKLNERIEASINVERITVFAVFIRLSSGGIATSRYNFVRTFAGISCLYHCDADAMNVLTSV